MGIIHNLDASQLQDILRRLRNLEAGSPMNNSAIGAGGIEVYDGGTINVSNGAIIVNGSLTGGGTFGWTGTFTQSGTTTFTGTSRFTGQTDIWGPLTVTGDTDLDGPTNVTGSFTVTGPTKLNGITDVGGAFTVTGLTKLQGNTTVSGDLDVTGALDIKGESTLQNDLTLTAGGRIKVGAMTLNPASGGGRIEFDNGAAIRGNGTGIAFTDGSSEATLNLSQLAVLQGQGSSVTVAQSGIQLSGPFTTVSGQLVVDNKPLAPSGAVANVYWDPVTNVFKLIP